MIIVEVFVLEAVFVVVKVIKVELHQLIVVVAAL